MFIYFVIIFLLYSILFYFLMLILYILTFVYFFIVLLLFLNVHLKTFVPGATSAFYKFKKNSK